MENSPRSNAYTLNQSVTLTAVPVSTAYTFSGWSGPIAAALSRSFDSAFVERASDLPRNPPVPVTAIYSRKDGIVPWQSCLIEEGPLSENVEVDSAHTIMGSNPKAMRVIAERLAPVEPNART